MNTPQFPAEPMAAFFAAVTAVETGQVGEVELTFTYETETTSMGPGYAICMAIEIRKNPRHFLNGVVLHQEKEGER